jgi:single-stranded-DNA-specific exonuclease
MLADACDLGLSAAQVLLHRGVERADEAEPLLDATLRGLSSPEPMADRALASERIGRAIRTGERIVVFGDYDVDGTTSAIILSDIIRVLGGNVHTLIADRFRGGYGLSDAALTRCLEADPGLLITCDCGSSDHERIARARALGIDVIVVDHHLVPEETLPAFAFLNPHRPECGFADKGLCSAGLAFSLGAALRNEMDSKLDVRGWLDLVAVGTIADLAPLTGDNRRLVRAGLKRLASSGARPALQLLREAARIPESGDLTAQDVAFRFSPKLNAPGRLGEAELTLKFLTTQRLADARRLLGDIEARNDERKALGARATEEALAQAIELYGETPSHGVVLASPDWHRGVVGIVAARIVERLGVPAAVVAFDGEYGHGSVRTVGDFDVHSALEQCTKTLTAWGGHRAAAGLSVDATMLERFRAAFADASPRDTLNSSATVEIDLALGGPFRLPTSDDLRRLGPFGQAFEAPLFQADALVVESNAVGEGGAHAKLELQIGQERIRAFAPGLFERVEGRTELRVVGEIQPDHWVGRGAVEFLVKDVVD